VSRAVLLVERRRVAISRRHRGVPFDVLIAISSGRRPESIAAKIAEGTPLCRPLWRWRRIERAHALLTNPSYTLSEPDPNPRMRARVVLESRVWREREISHHGVRSGSGRPPTQTEDACESYEGLSASSFGNAHKFIRRAAAAMVV